MDEAVTRLTAHLKEQPDDLTGWLLLARSQISLEHFQQAADAYRRAAELSGQRADIVGDWGEAQVMAAGGTVTPAAKQAFEAAAERPGDRRRARAITWRWRSCSRATQRARCRPGRTSRPKRRPMPNGCRWCGSASQRPPRRWASTRQRRKPLPPRPRRRPRSTPLANSAPDPAAVAAAAKATAGASPEDRQAMIQGMVERLAARLQTQPDDVEGWTRLGRSYIVLNQPERAGDAYAHAVKLKSDDIELKEQYAEALIRAAGNDTAPPPAAAVLREVLQAEPQNQMALWYVGLAAAEAGHSDDARSLWTRLLATLPATAPERREIEDRLAALKPAAAK